MTLIYYNFFAAGPRIILFFAVLFSFSAADFSQKPAAADANVILKQCWNFPVPEAGIASLTGDEHGVFTATFSGDVSAFDAKSGEKIWTSELGGAVVSDILIDAKRVYIATNSAAENGPTTIRTLSRETGITLWSGTFPRSQKIYLVADPTGLIAMSDSGKAARFDSADGKLVWQKDLAGKVAAKPLFSAEVGFYASGDRRINSIDPISGAAKDSKDIEQKAVFLGGTQDYGILFGDDRGRLTKWTSDHAVSWQFKAGGRITKAVRTKEGILAASDDNFVYMIWDYNGDVTWKIRLSGRVSDIAVLNESLGAATAVGSNEVFILDLSKGRAVTRIGGADSDAMIGSILSTADGKLITATNADVKLYSLDGCNE